MGITLPASPSAQALGVSFDIHATSRLVTVSRRTHMTTVMLYIIMIVGFVVYLTPTIIANNRQHPQTAAIFALNILLGWSALGWIASFVWSLTGVETYGSFDTSSGDPGYVVVAASDNPYHPFSAKGQAWSRGVADSKGRL
jgi:Superinfection immunity protein